MPPRKIRPTYRKHSTRNFAICSVYNHTGERVVRCLPGAFESAESWAGYEALVAELLANGGRLAPPPSQVPSLPTINELVLRFLDERVAVEYVDADGNPTQQQECYRLAVRPVARLFGPLPAASFDAAQLESVRAAMIDGSWMNEKERARSLKQRGAVDWSRNFVNKNIGLVRTMFRWAVLKKIVPASVVTDLECLPPLAKGRGKARETAPVEPVAPEVVDATLPFLTPYVADMVRVQLLIGCRPGEVCSMRCGEIDRSGPVWLYKPASHKTEHLGHTKTVAIGPQAQLILRRFLKDDPAAFVFSPIEQYALLVQRKRENRKTPVQPSQVDRSKPNPMIKPGESFDERAYNRAVARACRRAGVKRWHVHQLRHTAALLIGREHGPEAARSVLGHKTLNMTLFYAGVDLEKATEVARRMG